ncbi:MarR family transcriptional regulator [Novosphingobium lentum]|uniref:MarR family transcriptional regulator n=1 Tax=Novosphingobium lentum TaxID=145287 RepID=UPI001FE02910|nr:MarR family transcriptional regulator [Novosphingobium lentum]
MSGRMQRLSARPVLMPGKAQPINAQSEVEARLIDKHGGAHNGRHASLILARELYAERRRRHRFFAPDLFGEPTWDLLLDLFIATSEERRVPTTSACIGANVPPTTALRWLRILESRGLIEREDDGRDGRRTFVRLSAKGMAAMDAFLGSTRSDLLVQLMACEDQGPRLES